MSDQMPDFKEFVDGMLEGVAGIVPGQLFMQEATAWDRYLIALIGKGGTPENVIAGADFLLEARRARFGVEACKKAMLAAQPNKGELRAIK